MMSKAVKSAIIGGLFVVFMGVSSIMVRALADIEKLKADESWIIESLKEIKQDLRHIKRMLEK